MEKRFNLQQEGFARNRVETLRQSMKELREQYPEIISLLFFGSLSKGESKVESDIDGVLFVDAEYIAEQEKNEGGDGDTIVVVKSEEEIPGLQTHKISQKIFLRQDLYNKYNSLLQDRIRQHDPSLTVEQVEHLRSMPISEGKLVEVLDDLIASKNQMLEYDEKLSKAHTGGMNKEEILKTAQSIGGMPEIIMETPTLWLASMFHLDIGGGIKKYRKILIDKLLTSGEAGDKIWRDIIMRVESWEQKMDQDDLPSETHYPRTLSEAEKVYCH